MPAKTLNKLLAENNKYIRMATDDKERHYFTSGILKLNFAIADNNGRGIPGGSLIQILGKEKAGKSTLTLDFLAQAQRSGIKEIEIPAERKQSRLINAAYVDFERSFDPVYARKLGVDLDKLLLIETVYAEESFDIIEALLAEGLQFVIIDSIAMVVPQSEEDKSNQDNEKMGAEAKAIGRFTKHAIQLADHANALILLINQYRANISTMSPKERKPFGANIIQYAVKGTIELTRISKTETRTTVKAFIEKTKFGPEAKQLEFDIIFGEGPDYAMHILQSGIDEGIVTGTGWYEYGGQKAQGKKNAAETLDIAAIEKELRRLWNA